jgi:hypothetical protein
LNYADQKYRWKSHSAIPSENIFLIIDNPQRFVWDAGGWEWFFGQTPTKA